MGSFSGHFKKTLVWFALLGAQGGAAERAFAQPSRDELLSLSLKELLSVKVSAATQTDESILSVPSAVTVFERSQIEKLGMDYLHELLDLVPGIQSQRAGDSSVMYSSSSRGRRNGSQTKEILLVVDGRIFNSPRNGSANGARQLFPLSLIEKVEIIRGPGSAVYGANAYTGVIKVTSRKKRSGAAVTLTDPKQWGLDASLAEQWKDKQLDINFSIADSNGEKYSLLTASDNLNNADSNTQDPFHRAELDVGYQSGSDTFRWYWSNIEAKDFFTLESIKDGLNRVETEYMDWYWSHRFDWSENSSSELSLNHLQGTYYLNVELLPARALAGISQPASDDALIAYGKLEESVTHLKYHHQWQLSVANQLQLGIEAKQENEIEARTYTNFSLEQLANGQLPVEYYGDFDQFSLVGTEDDRSSYAIYGQMIYQWREGLNVTLGARFDDYHRAGSRLSPRLGLVKSFNDSYTLKLLYGEAFRAPALNETQLLNNPVVIGNPELSHEMVKTWEAIWMWTSPQQMLAAHWYHNRFVNPINTVLVGNVRQFVNGESVESQGIEIEASQQLGERWYLRQTYSDVFEAPDSAFREAERTGSIMLNYQSSRFNWNLSVVYHGDKQFLSGSEQNTIDSHWLVNSRWIYQAEPQWQWSLVVKNLLDDEHLSAPTGNIMQQALPGRGREIQLEIRWQN